MDAADVAREIVSAAANGLCLDMRFLTVAVLSLRTEVLPGKGPPECDGRRIVFRADSVISDYREEPNLPARSLAHCVLHCVLGHTGRSDEEMLAEDMVAEYVLDSLDAPGTSVAGRDDRMYACEKIFSRAGAPAPDLMAPRISELSDWQRGLYGRMFVRDDGRAHQEEDDPAWREIAQQVMVEIEGFVRAEDGSTDSLMSILRIRNRRRYDYRSFLRKFVGRRSGIREDPEQFDPIYYTYGLRTYGNLPLIDSLETADRRLREFVVAVDTSGSTMRGPVEAFIEETFSAIRQAGVGSGARIHVVQCDDRIRSDDVITSEADMRALMSRFELRGGGGTDFRPVFDYVEELRSQGELAGLRGLLYFTDGRGTFPERRPPYDTAFVFCDDAYSEHRVPPWAMRLEVRTSDLTGGHS